MISPGNYSSWWGRHTVASNRTELWRIGPLQIWLEGLPHQWRLSWMQGHDWLDSRIRNQPGVEQEPIPYRAQQLTCVFGAGQRDEIVFTPILPDRSVITRLPSALHVLPDEEVNLYVVTPLWLRLDMAQPAKPLKEIPIFRLSDTWFGPMSGAGELCYASSSSAYLDLREVPLRMHCVITAITIRNQGPTALKLDRLNVPLPRLSLFYSPRTGFWTDVVVFERREDTEMATLKLAKQPPPDASPTQFISGPRITSGESSRHVMRAFSALFREKGQS